LEDLRKIRNRQGSGAVGNAVINPDKSITLDLTRPATRIKYDGPFIRPAGPSIDKSTDVPQVREDRVSDTNKRLKDPRERVS
jgi:hypothetical protein